MSKFEYRVEVCKNLLDATTLNEIFGQNRWELVSIQDFKQYNEMVYFYYFKRKLTHLKIY